MTPTEIRKEVERISRSGGIVQPSASDVHVNRPLTNISIAFMQAADAFVATRIFQNIAVMKQSDAYFSYDREAWFRSQMEERKPGTESAGATFMVDTDTYYAKVYALHDDIPDQVRANTDMPLNMDSDSTEFLTMQSMLLKEKTFASSFLQDGVWTLSADGNATVSSTLDFLSDGNNNIVFWSADDSDPIGDVRRMKTAVQLRTGFRPNVLTIARYVYDILVEHPDIIDRLNRGQTTGTAQANRDDLMRLLELDDLIIMDAVENTSGIGATASYKFIGDKDGLLSYRPASPGLRVPAAGYTFSWRGYIGASDMGSRVFRFRMNALRSDRIEIESAFVFKQVSADLGVFLDGIVQ